MSTSSRITNEWTKQNTNLALEVQDMDHLKIWRKGEEMILADAPSRWSSHMGRLTELTRQLPLPPLKVTEIIKTLFEEPVKFGEMTKHYYGNLSRGTMLGIKAPVVQAPFEEC